MHEIKKILVIRLSSLGDIILSYPLLKILRKKFPEAEIHFLTGKNYSEVLRLNENTDRIIEAKKDREVTRKEIQDEKYDIILDIHKNLKSIYFSKNNAPDVRRIVKNNFKKFLLVKFKINLFKEIIPVYKKYLLTIADYLNKDDYKFSVSDLKVPSIEGFDFKYSVIAPSSRHFTKTYPAEKFIEFINTKSNETFILTGSSDNRDMEICDKINSACVNTRNLCGKLSIPELAAVIKKSGYVISNDSAILHLSEALGKKTTGIFGSTVKEFGFFPQLETSGVIEIKDLKCRPCTHIGLPACPEKHFKCMMDIDVTKLNIEIKN
ncbi:MAG: glycosyltransferase family 9 protein [Ignavibacteria bacterium]|nr:glycosyltransferase family 9 protein [Ignavibacteria bacterium]